MSRTCGRYGIARIGYERFGNGIFIKSGTRWISQQPEWDGANCCTTNTTQSTKKSSEAGQHSTLRLRVRCESILTICFVLFVLKKILWISSYENISCICTITHCRCMFHYHRHTTRHRQHSLYCHCWLVCVIIKFKKNISSFIHFNYFRNCSIPFCKRRSSFTHVNAYRAGIHTHSHALTSTHWKRKTHT